MQPLIDTIPKDRMMAERMSVPPGVTWPMVAYRFVKELPTLIFVLGASVVCFMFVWRSPAQFGDAILGLVGAGAVGQLGRSKPAEDR
jgi:hypothetical protein